MKEVRIGVIGCGGISTHQHLPHYTKIPEVRLVAVCDIIESLAEGAAEKYGAEAWYTDYKELLDREDIDGVSIATPPKWHSEIAIYAAKAGKDILCEKPLARNVKEADAMVEAARNAGVKLMAGYQPRFAWSTNKIKQIIDDGWIGKPVEILYIHKKEGPGKPWFYDKEIAGGGIGLDGVVYQAYLFQYFLGKIKTVYAKRDMLFPERVARETTGPQGRIIGKISSSVEDTLALSLTFVNGATGLLYRSWWTHKFPPTMRYEEVYGLDGYIVSGRRENLRGLEFFTTKDIPGLIKGWHFLPEPRQVDTPHFKRIREFVDCIKYDREPLVTGEEGRDAVEVIEAAYISAEEGRVVELPLPRN